MKKFNVLLAVAVASIGALLIVQADVSHLGTGMIQSTQDL